jgi:hypothetical protein
MIAFEENNLAGAMLLQCEQARYDAMRVRTSVYVVAEKNYGVAGAEPQVIDQAAKLGRAAVDVTDNVPSHCVILSYPPTRRNDGTSWKSRGGPAMMAVEHYRPANR